MTGSGVSRRESHFAPRLRYWLFSGDKEPYFEDAAISSRRATRGFFCMSIEGGRSRTHWGPYEAPSTLGHAWGMPASIRGAHPDHFGLSHLFQLEAEPVITAETASEAARFCLSR
jgi:hypothetical protein